MQVAMIGLGRMDMNIARRHIKGGRMVVAYNRSLDNTDRLTAEGAAGAYSLDQVIEKLKGPTHGRDDCSRHRPGSSLSGLSP